MKKLHVSNEVQKALFDKLLKDEIINGFWTSITNMEEIKATWSDVECEINGKLGPVNFKISRNYNFANPNFIKIYKDTLISIASKVIPGIKFSEVKEQLISLNRIVGGRMKEIDGPIEKMNNDCKIKNTNTKHLHGKKYMIRRANATFINAA